ncbi:16S rRNA (uracil(1498)-N(3))-methyltransferase [Hyphomicrobium sp.]|uniref:16S rRNA (uracil(1498)-N(3))-methyltransferase n=1 Tax=Hyphomicrobium sp. TaxID=82 RepID=UPI002CA3B4C2|nr:16S rRNA (uracil(1498)-N(3))-methyltransferase [Hyphomicrobium sp.]HRN88538.1 16S rRNA (uracil(1498)-N(3))-methyltransferase [Hyphomicrobium sp.]HRQ26792.1 16S rRNA (uracil(1498)-N(3))-methyltransferase [Hyphomicrobium sp.]
MAVHDFNSQRLFVDAPLAEGTRAACSPEQASYLRSVLRLADGDEILVFNGRDGEWRARLVAEGKRGAVLEAVELVRAQTGGPDLHYLFAPLKRARLDYMVQKATEMGAARLVPVLTRHTVAERVNLDRMRANAIEAAEQCGILRVPEIAEPVKLSALLDGWDAARTLVFCDEAAEQASPIAALSSRAAGPLAVLIGPEGGFSPDERAMIRAVPEAIALSLGPRIMRADTAAVAALALVNAVLGDWR